MPDVQERMLGGIVVQIDRTLCVGFGDCVTASPEAFGLDDEDTAVFLSPEVVGRQQLIQACQTCPVDALSVIDADGRRLVP